MHGVTLRSDHECPPQAYSPENINNYMETAYLPHGIWRFAPLRCCPTAFANSPRRTPAKVEGDKLAIRVRILPKQCTPVES